MRSYVVAVVGATGAVGQEMLRVLEERNFPVRVLKPLASQRSAGKNVTFQGTEVPVEEAVPEAFRGVEIALFSAGTGVSKELAPQAVARGAVVIDNSNAFRMDPGVPLVVPEVNPGAMTEHRGLIANPNCSTIQMVVVLKPLHDRARLRRVIVSTYQSVSGTGLEAMAELRAQSEAYLAGRDSACEVYPHPIAFNILPHIDIFDEQGNSREEMKMVHETRKIMDEPQLAVTATTVRVPVFRCHSEAVNLEFEERLPAGEARKILERAPGVIVVDDPGRDRYPLARDCEHRNEVFVGRIRDDTSHPMGLNLWIVSDNLRKGAAWNAVQIAEQLAGAGLVRVPA